MQNVVPCQIASYFALLHDMVTYEQIINNKPSSDDEQYKNFKQILKFNDGLQLTTYLPPYVAPNSAIQFWCGQLKLMEDSTINSYIDEGYSSIEQTIAEVLGYYEFYTCPRLILSIFK